ncbi:MAG: hypothetical protein R3Y35_13430 [Clostridia bacterium]
MTVKIEISSSDYGTIIQMLKRLILYTETTSTTADITAKNIALKNNHKPISL